MSASRISRSRTSIAATSLPSMLHSLVTSVSVAMPSADAASPARPQPALAARRREAIDRALAIGFVFGSRRSPARRSACCPATLSAASPVSWKNSSLASDNLVVRSDANTRDAERAKLLKQRRGVRFGIVDQVGDPCREIDGIAMRT